MTLSLTQMIQLALGGVVGSHSAGADLPMDSGLVARVMLDSVGAVVLNNPLNEGRFNLFANHGSHRSHSSHSSHSSHYSGSGGSYGSSYPVSPPPQPAPSSEPATASISHQALVPESRSSTTSSPTTTQAAKPASKRPVGDQLKVMVMRVQAALYSRGYDPGAIDGEFSDATKSALRQFQSTNGLQVTGKMTTETLTALNVSLQ